MEKRKVVIFTGAGISAESGLKTFRGDDGLWEGYRVQDVATPKAWAKDPDLVQHFYNIRRKDCIQASPNLAHQYLVELEKDFDVKIITQNIDDLHERAGSQNVLHLHGEIRKAQSSKTSQLVFPIDGDEIKMGELCLLGSQLRPHVVWFGEAVPNMEVASQIANEADIFIVIGTSLQVYPAANLLYDIKSDCTLILVDPHADKYRIPERTITIATKATESIVYLSKILAK